MTSPAAIAAFNWLSVVMWFLAASRFVKRTTTGSQAILKSPPPDGGDGGADRRWSCPHTPPLYTSGTTDMARPANSGPWSGQLSIGWCWQFTVPMTSFTARGYMMAYNGATA